MKKILFIAIGIVLSVTVKAESFYMELNVKPKEVDEFKKPLPEMLIFSEEGKCVYQKPGFSNEKDFFANLDLVFGIKSDDLPSGLTRSKFVAEMVKNNPSIAGLPKEEQEKISNGMLEQVIAQVGPHSCETKLFELIKTMQDSAKKSFNYKKLNKSLFTLVEYSAEWCQPCREQENALKKYIELRGLTVNWLKVDRDPQKIASTNL